MIDNGDDRTCDNGGEKPGSGGICRDFAGFGERTSGRAGCGGERHERLSTEAQRPCDRSHGKRPDRSSSLMAGNLQRISNETASGNEPYPLQSIDISPEPALTTCRAEQGKRCPGTGNHCGSIWETEVPAKVPNHDRIAGHISAPVGSVAFRRIPGRSSGLPTNSMPARSSADLIAASVEVWLGGMPSNVSRRLMVLRATPDMSAKLCADNRSVAREARICAAVIIDLDLYCPYGAIFDTVWVV